jgi:secreted trypsin-like serine protease
MYPRGLLVSLSVMGLAACGPAGSFELPSPDSDRAAQAIVGGVAHRGDPAVVALVSVRNGAVSFACTGTLVSPVAVLTAGHCVTDRREGVTWYAVFGDQIPTKVNDRFVALDDQVAHPSYDSRLPERAEFDIALMRLAAPKNDVKPVALYEPALTEEDVGRSIRHVGFGATNTGAADGSGAKRLVTVPVRDVAHQLEAGSEGQGTCFGDSGGPGFMIPPGGTEEAVEGVVSWGDADCASSNWNTRVDLHVEWLRSMLSRWEPAPVPAPQSSGVASAAPPATPVSDTRGVERLDGAQIVAVGTCSSAGTGSIGLALVAAVAAVRRKKI